MTFSPMSDDIERAYERLRADFLKPRRRFPWVNADLQTLRNTLVRPSAPGVAASGKDVQITFRDGDQTICHIHEPSTALRQYGTIALIHGLGGDASGTMIGFLCHSLMAAGFNVARINLRAAPMVYHLASRISHAGKTEDLADILRGLEDVLGKQAWHLLGISLGGNMVAKALGTGALEGLNVVSAMTLCAPLDMQAASDTIMQLRNTIYEKYLLRGLKKAVLETGMERQWKEIAAGTTSVYDFDDKVTGPYHGFGDAGTYYARASAGPHLGDVDVPTLVMTAQDDPWIPQRSYAPYKETMSASVLMLAARHGGHVGFHYKGTDTPAYCEAAVRWFTATAN